MDNFTKPTSNLFYRSLKWSERYIKTDMIYLFKGGLWLTLGQIFTSLATFILAIAFANFISKENYGTYKYVLNVAAVLTIPTLTGMGTAVTNAVARGFEGSYIPALKARIRWGALSALASFGLAAYYYLDHNAPLGTCFAIAGIFLPFLDPFSLYDAFLFGKKFFALDTKYTVIAKTVATVFMIATIFLTKNLVFLVLGYFIPWTVTRLVFMLRTLRLHPPNARQEVGTISYGKHLSVMDAITTTADSLDALLIFNYLGAAVLAVYTIAIAPSEQIKSLLKNVTTLALPKYAEQNRDQIRKSMVSKMIKLGAGIVVVVVIYIAWAPLFYKLFFPKYLDAVWYSQLFSISLISAVSMLPLSALQAHSQKKSLYVVNIAGSIFQIVSLFVLIYLFGLAGAIWARVIFRILNIGLIYGAFKSSLA